jgi:ABC-type Fe3+-hydroxamate transport system substrate-binding protein
LLAGLYRTRTPPSEIAELISGIGWVSQLIAIAGGTDIFGDRASQGAAKDRVVTIDEVIAREPDLIIGSWCGKKFRPERVMARPRFDRTRPRSIET